MTLRIVRGRTRVLIRPGLDIGPEPVDITDMLTGPIPIWEVTPDMLTVGTEGTILDRDGEHPFRVTAAHPPRDDDAHRYTIGSPE